MCTDQDQGYLISITALGWIAIDKLYTFYLEDVKLIKPANFFYLVGIKRRIKPYDFLRYDRNGQW